MCEHWTELTMARTLLVIIVVSVVVCFKSVFACNGYTIDVHSIKDCTPNSVIHTENLTLTLDNDCNIIPAGCIVITKPYNKAEAHYRVSKPPMPVATGVMDLCETFSHMDNSTAAKNLNTLGLPRYCPVEPHKVCGSPEKKVDVNKFKNHLYLAIGKIDLKIDIIHNTGKSCLAIDFSVLRLKTK